MTGAAVMRRMQISLENLVLLTTLLCILHQAVSNKPPRFMNFVSNLMIQEDEPVGSTVGVLEAVDEDDDYLEFSIRSEVVKDILELRRVDPKKMEMVLKNPLDRERVEMYSTLLEVTDGVNPIQKYATIYVLDVNDNAPSFINLPYRAEVPEDSALESFVYKVSATDPDSGVWGLVSYNITTRQGLFEINTANGNVTLLDHLNYEEEKFYQLELMAVDGGGLNSTTDLIVNVLDVQDTAPFFLNLPYMAEVYENATVGSPVLYVSALDGDRGVPNPVNYSFISGAHEYFRLDPQTGELSVGMPMNREDPKVLEQSGVLLMTVLTEEDTPTPKGPTRATAPATIRILDVNDQIPTFNQSTYQATVLENTQARIPVTLLPIGTEMIVSDWDEADNGRFELSLEQSGMPFNVFEVFPGKILNVGNALIRVKNSSALDYEEVRQYTFNVIAREYLTPERHESRVTMTVHLEDVNDNWPEFDNDEYKVELPENSPLGTSVTTITATDRDSGIFGEITYTLGGRSATLFRVDSKSGQVFVNVAADQDHSLLDRETMDTHSLSYTATDGGGLLTAVQLEITLMDVNDNAPYITRSQYDGYIKENDPTLEREVIVEAIDIDLPPNNIVKFSITSGDPLRNFTINEDSGVVQVRGPLDYEAMDPAVQGVYTIAVMANDMGSPQLSSSTTVLVSVQDVNDETPYFERTLYTATIPENSTEGTEVARVFARDDDGTSPNNEVIYRIESGARDKFRIDAENGLISVETRADLDRDVYAKEYILKVMAIDRGTPPLTGTTSVQITITDVNNKHPVFNPPQHSIRILENTTVGTVFYTYSATDLDENAVLKYAFLDAEVTGEDETGQDYPDKYYLKNLFGVHVNNGSIYVKSKLDRETVEQIRLVVFVEDIMAEQPPIQNATAFLTITLGDVNDNPPIFDPSNVYYARVSEASQPGVEVTRVIAIDKDKNPGPVRYFISYDSPQSKAFDITDTNRLSGIITLAKGVDHEEQTWINVTVEAIDSGVPPLNSTATVHIEIEDVNDNSPEWQVFETPVEVWENATLDTNVTVVYATDRDSGEYGRVMYYITNGNTEGKFSVYNETGLVVIRGELDREEVPDYLLTIEARDNNFAPVTQQRNTPNYMKVILKDVNDNAPEFEKLLYEAEIPENRAVQMIVLSVRATDRDEGTNAMIDYSVDTTGGNASSLFDVHTSSGEVYVKRALQGNIGQFLLVVRATDRGDPPLYNTTNVVITVQDVNDHAPEIIQPPENTTIYIMENVPINYWVTQVYAEDKDAGINGEVWYQLIESPNNQDWRKFDISLKGGNVTTAGSIDREEQETYYIEVRAFDQGTPSYEDRRTLTIVALDEDDNPPSFDRTKYPPPFRVSVEEEQGNIFVANLDLAEDPDIGENSRICYYLVGGDNPWKSHFRIVKNTGDLWLDTALDREVIPYVNLVVKASEDCLTGIWERPENQNLPWNISDTTQLLVEVKILDINDNPPRFTKNWFTAGVTKDTQFEEQVMDLTEYASDPDEGENARMFFYLVPPFRISEPLGTRLRDRGENTPFKLGVDDGIILTNIYFQADMQGYIDFEVKVTDINPDHQDKSNISIYLLNQEQRVKVIIRGDTNYVGTFKDIFAEFLSNITGAIINVDKIMTHQDGEGRPDIRRTDMFIHGIDARTGEVLAAQVLIDLIDKNYIHLVDLFNRYNVIEIQPAVSVVSSGLGQEDLQLALILVAVVLAILIIIVAATFCFCRRKYRRKLKAANAMAFENQPATIGTRDNGLNKLEMPGTNLHTYEGSNPIWLEQYENGWPRDSDTDSKNSIDENMLEPPPPSRQGPGFDEQELSMEMYNDEFDHYNRLPLSKQKREADANLRAAIQDHRNSNPQGVPQNGHSNHVPHLNNVNGPPKVKMNGGPSNGKIGNHRSVYDNSAFTPDQLQATEI